MGEVCWMLDERGRKFGKSHRDTSFDHPFFWKLLDGKKTGFESSMCEH